MRWWKTWLVAGLVMSAGRADATVGLWKSESFAIDLTTGSMKPASGPTDRNTQTTLGRPCGPNTGSSRISVVGATLVVENFDPGGWTKHATVTNTLPTGDAIRWHALIKNRLIVANEVRARRSELDIHAYDVATGLAVWQVSTKRHGLSCTDLDHGLIALDLEMGLRAFDLDTGKVRFTIPIVAASGVVLTNLGEDRWLAVGDKAMASFDGARGTIAWKRAVVGSEVKRSIVLGTELLVGFKRPDAAERKVRFELVAYDLRRGIARPRSTLRSSAWDAPWTELDDLRSNPDDPTQISVTIGTYGPVGP